MDFTEHILKAGKCIKFILATKEKIKDLELRLSFFNIVFIETFKLLKSVVGICD